MNELARVTENSAKSSELVDQFVFCFAISSWRFSDKLANSLAVPQRLEKR